MAQNLPNEVVDLFLHELHAADPVEKQTIARCGLVCRNWLPFSRYHFFAQVFLDDRNMKPFLRMVETSPFSIPSFIRSIALHFRRGDRSLDQGLRLLGPLPQVTTLRIFMPHAVFASNSALFAASFAYLSTLVFRGYEYSPHNFLSAVTSFPLLTSLRLESVTFSDEPVSSALQFPPHCRSLTLYLTMTDIERWFRAFLSLDTIPVVSSLTVRGMFTSEDSFFGRYLRHIGDGMHHLRFEFDLYTVPTRIAPTCLRYSSGLRNLELAYHGDWDLPEGILGILSHLQTTRLAVVTIIDNVITKISRDEWPPIDQALADERFSNLESFTVQTARPYVREYVLALMSLSQSRGILRVDMELP
ncbi:hypothetical protein FB451DRAFT_1403192 [Mycena latifolia]|nr:hypothetical protein FB451DRAFT_1403192 [Mycena latifolia]